MILTAVQENNALCPLWKTRELKCLPSCKNASVPIRGPRMRSSVRSEVNNVLSGAGKVSGEPQMS